MNIVQLSNLFNQVCQSINVSTPGRVGFYHFGWYSDINTNIQNNWTGQNTVGKLYPSIQFLYPTGSLEIKEKRYTNTLRCTMVFSDLQYYNNDGTMNQRSIIEVFRDLEALVVNVFSEFNRVGRTAPYQIGFQGPVQTDYISDQHNDNLCLIKCDFTIWYQMDCPIDTVDIPNLPIGFNDVPPSSNDYELL
jgi:hypothetical protein